VFAESCTAPERVRKDVAVPAKLIEATFGYKTLQVAAARHCHRLRCTREPATTPSAVRARMLVNHCRKHAFASTCNAQGCSHTATCFVLSLVKAQRSQSPQRSRKRNPAIRAMRSSSRPDVAPRRIEARDPITGDEVVVRHALLGRNVEYIEAKMRRAHVEGHG